jgi:D-alanyl-D-alanine carboxypeptidase
VVSSAPDAAVATANAVGGSVAGCGLPNVRPRTRYDGHSYASINGESPAMRRGDVTTARDLARLAQGFVRASRGVD